MAVEFIRLSDLEPVPFSPQTPMSNRGLKVQNLDSPSKPGINYSRPFKEADGAIYSIDMVRIRYTVRTRMQMDQSTYNTMSYILSALDAHYMQSSDVQWYEQVIFKIGCYRWAGKIENQNGGVITVLAGRYDFKEYKGMASEIVLEYNPNKVDEENIEFAKNLLNNRAVDINITRLDIACDLPFARNDVVLRTIERRSFSQFGTAEERTEYLGKRSNHGAVKIYNKALESGISGNLTRVEVTVEPMKSGIPWPEIYIVKDFQADINFTTMPFEVQACILHPDLIDVLKQSVAKHTWMKYKKQIDGAYGCKYPFGGQNFDAWYKWRLLSLVA